MSGLELATVGMALGWLSFVLHLAAFVVFGFKAHKGESTPNMATWTIWVFATALNCTSYFVMSEDWVKALQPFAGALACLTIFLLALRQRRSGSKRQPLPLSDIIMMVIGVIAVSVWYLKRDATYANLILQSAFVVSFIPTLRAIWREPEKESSLPWFMWGGSYALLIATVVCRWQDNPADLAYPINSFFWHALAGFLALRRLRKG